MKRLLAIALLMLAAGSAHAWKCTNGSTNYPDCDNYTPPPKKPPPPVVVPPPVVPPVAAGPKQGQQQGQQQGQNATGGTGIGTGTATAATGPVNASGGAGGAGGKSKAKASADSQINAGNDSSKVYGIAVGIPGPVTIPALPANNGCPYTNSDEYNSAYGPAFYSHAEAKTNTDNCLRLKFIENLRIDCREESARRANDSWGKTLFPDWQPVEPNKPLYEASSEEDCIAHKFGLNHKQQPERISDKMGSINIVNRVAPQQICERKPVPRIAVTQRHPKVEMVCHPKKK